MQSRVAAKAKPKNILKKQWNHRYYRIILYALEKQVLREVRGMPMSSNAFSPILQILPWVGEAARIKGHAVAGLKKKLILSAESRHGRHQPPHLRRKKHHPYDREWNPGQKKKKEPFLLTLSTKVAKKNQSTRGVRNKTTEWHEWRSNLKETQLLPRFAKKNWPLFKHAIYLLLIGFVWSCCALSVVRCPLSVVPITTFSVSRHFLYFAPLYTNKQTKKVPHFLSYAEHHLNNDTYEEAKKKGDDFFF